MTQRGRLIMRHFSIHSFKTGGWTPYIRRISGVSIPRPWKSSILISDTPAFVESAGSLPFDASTPLLSPVFAFDTAFDEEQEQSSDSTRNDTLYTTRYQPRDIQILILLITITQTTWLLAKIVLIFTIVKDQALQYRCYLAKVSHSHHVQGKF